MPFVVIITLPKYLLLCQKQAFGVLLYNNTSISGLLTYCKNIAPCFLAHTRRNQIAGKQICSLVKSSEQGLEYAHAVLLVSYQVSLFLLLALNLGFATFLVLFGAVRICLMRVHRRETTKAKAKGNNKSESERASAREREGAREGEQENKRDTQRKRKQERARTTATASENL